MPPRGRVLTGASLVAISLGASCAEPDRAAHPLGPGTRAMDIGAGHVDSPPLPPLVDRAAVYDAADLGPIEIRLTVEDEPAFRAVEANAPGARARVSFAAGPPGGAAPATVELRGETSRSAAQRSYQIKLAADAAPWRGSRTINLLKHPFDLTRVRNTLSFETFRRIDGLVSLRTGFVHLFIDSVDRGLYEWIEEPDAGFLAARGLDPGGALYKAKNLAFDPIDAVTAADATRMDGIVAAKGTPDLPKLRRMLAAVNDPTHPIDRVIGHYFNRENYVTWLAVNVLVADFDSTTQNFMLYSPSGHEGWYFLPWDYDTAWGWNEQPGAPRRPRRREGLANWWSVVLHRRFLSEPANVDLLAARIADLAAATITDAETARMLTRTRDLVMSFVSVPPDVDHLPCERPGTPAAVLQWHEEITRIAGNASRALAEFHSTVDRPMPFVLQAPAFPSPGRVVLSWSPSWQLRAQAITYDVEVNAGEAFDPAQVLTAATGLTEPHFTTMGLPSGRFFWRVVARAAKNPSVDWQLALGDHLIVVVP